MTDVGGPISLRGATPWLVVLDAIRKQTGHGEQASKQHPSVASASVPASRFLP